MVIINIKCINVIFMIKVLFLRSSAFSQPPLVSYKRNTSGRSALSYTSVNTLWGLILFILTFNLHFIFINFIIIIYIFSIAVILIYCQLLFTHYLMCCECNLLLLLPMSLTEK